MRLAYTTVVMTQSFQPQSLPPSQMQDHDSFRRVSYTDADLTFFMQVHNDHRRARWAITNLRRHFPSAPLIIVSDDDASPVWPKLARRFGATYHQGDALYGTASGGQIVQRMLDCFMEAPTDYLFKIDTDTQTHRRFDFLPTGRCVFGTLEWQTFARKESLHDLPSVQGGFVGYTREAAELIQQSHVLLSPDLVDDYSGTYADVPEIRERAERGMVSTDFLARYACRKLAIDCVSFPEVRSQYRGRVQLKRPDEYAFTHPHKELAGRHPWRQSVVKCLRRLGLISK